jgi:hypothetical protein
MDLCGGLGEPLLAGILGPRDETGEEDRFGDATRESHEVTADQNGLIRQHGDESFVVSQKHTPPPGG